MSALTLFNFNGSQVRITDREGAPWFVAADVCRILEISNPSQAVAALDEDEKLTLCNSEGQKGHGGAQSFSVINESGLYSLVLRSRKPQAKAFKKWITSEVLPQIRKTGGYGKSTHDAVDAFALLQQILGVKLKGDIAGQILELLLPKGSFGEMSDKGPKKGFRRAAWVTKGREREAKNLGKLCKKWVQLTLDIRVASFALEGGK